MSVNTDYNNTDTINTSSSIVSTDDTTDTNSSELTGECVICFEPFNAFNKKITCIHCNSDICYNCVVKSLRENAIVFSCPCCKQQWDLTFIYKNLPSTFINEELKPNYAHFCSEIDRAIKLQPYINEYKYLEDLNNLFINILSHYDFSKVNKDNIIILEDGTNYNLFFREYDKEESSYFYQHIDTRKCDISKDQINPIIDIYCMSNTSISFDTFMRIFAANNYTGRKFFLLFLLFNTLNGNLDNIINTYDLSLFNNVNLYGRIDDYYKHSDILKYNYDEKKYDYNSLKRYSKEEIIDYFHNNIFKDEKFFRDELNNNNRFKLPVCKCFKGNCDGDAYKYRNQVICNKCNSVFCSKCHVEIYPKYIEYADKNGIILVDNPKYDSYSDLQKGVYDVAKNNTNRKKKTTPMDEVIKEDVQHVCKEEDLNTIRLMYEGAKPCPNCGELINKNGGCKDMFCISCKTAFNWETMKIVSENTNPLFHAWRRQQRAANEQQNNRQNNSLQSEYNCEDLYNYEQCIKILNKIKELDSKENEHNKNVLKNFAKLVELRVKPHNDKKLNLYQKYYAYNLIDYDEYKRKTSTLYVSKFFIDQYNSVVSNTIYMVNSFFHELNNNFVKNKNKKKVKKTKVDDESIPVDYAINYDFVKETLKIHNEALSEFSKVYSLVVVLIDDDCIPYKVRNNVRVVKKIKKITIQKDPNVKYLLSPFYKYPKELYTKYQTIYDKFFKHHNKIAHLKNKYQFYTFFPDMYTIDDPVFLRILTDKELFNSLKKVKENQGSDHNKDGTPKEEFYYVYSDESKKILYKKYRINRDDKDYDIILEFYNDYIVDYKSTLEEFVARYNEVVNICKTSEFNFNTGKSIKTKDYMTKELTDRYKKIMKYMKYYYKCKLDSLITELDKINFDTDTVKNKSIFNRTDYKFASIMACEDQLMDIFVKLQS